jgi:hypothetical protein
LVAEEIFALIFFYRVFELPLLRNAQKRDKKSIEQPKEGGGQQPRNQPTPRRTELRHGASSVFLSAVRLGLVALYLPPKAELSGWALLRR